MSPLLEHMTGHWVLRGTIAKKPTVHDVDAAWVAQHRYLQIHEVSREKNADGQPQYNIAGGEHKELGRVTLTRK